jgi:thiol:disulfide interchange protein DsbD
MRLAPLPQLVIALTAFLVLAPSAPAASLDKDLVKTVLVADTTAIEPGKPFTLGVMFRIEPGWHIYWTNPGDAGEATKVLLQLPEGWKSEPVQLPLPKRFTQPGDIVGYGYEEQAMLLANVTPPQNLQSGDTVVLKAKVSWLVCEKVCIPGEAELSIALRVGANSLPENTKEFAEWRTRLPARAPTAFTRVEQAFDSVSKELLLTIDWPGDAPQAIEWFPPQVPDLTFADVRVSSSGKRTMLKVKCQPLGKKLVEPAVFEALLAYDDAGGARRGVVVRFAVGDGQPKRIPQG